MWAYIVNSEGCVCVNVCDGVSAIRELHSLPPFFLLDKHFVVLGRLLVLGFSCTVARRCSTELCMWGDLPLPLAKSRFRALHTQTHLHTLPHTHTHLWGLRITHTPLRCFKLTSCFVHLNGPTETQTITFTHMKHHTLPCLLDTYTQTHQVTYSIHFYPQGLPLVSVTQVSKQRQQPSTIKSSYSLRFNRNCTHTFSLWPVKCLTHTHTHT